jgi:hypothetical protein
MNRLSINLSKKEREIPHPDKSGFGMTPGLIEDKGEGSSGDLSECWFSNKMTIELPLLPSTHTLKKMCHPETHPPMDTSLKQWI